MAFVDRLDRFQRKHRVVGFPLAVLYKFIDDQGNYLAALITYYAFIGIFPLLLLATSILAFVLRANPDLQQQILDSTLAQFPVIGEQLGRPGGIQGSRAAVVIGTLGAFYGASGVAQATQNAMNIAWGVPRNKRGNPLVLRARSLVLMLTAGTGLLATTFLSTVGSEVDAFGTQINAGLALLRSAAAVLLNAGVFILLFRLSTAHPHSLKRAVPGAIVTAITLQVLQVLGTKYVAHVVQPASGMNGIFALVLGLVAWIYIVAISVVFGVEINVVKAHRLHPRALLTPFTDNVDLTEGDRRAYTDYAEATRSKDFESVEVRFEYDGQYATAKRLAKEHGNGMRGASTHPVPTPTMDTETRIEKKPHKHH